MKAGSLPRNWVQAPLSELASVFQGQSPPGSTYNAEGVGLPFLQGSAEFGELSPSPTKWCSEPVRVADQGDILISIRAPVGPTNVADQRYCIGRGLAAIRASHCIEPAFLLHQIRHSVAALVDRATGTTFDAIGGSVLRDHTVVVAPLPEQRGIVEAIDSYLTRLDDAVASLERVQAKLKAYRASVLKAAVAGRLVPTEASLARAEQRAYEPAEALLARILKERRRRWEEAELAKLKAAGKTPKDDTWKAKYEEPVAPDMSRLPELPEGWCWTSLGALIVDGPQNGIYVPKSQYGEGTPILRIDDYQVDWSRSASELQRVKLSVDDRARFGLSLGDLVLNRVNSPSHLGKTLAVEARHLPAVFESNMMRFTPSGALSSRFLHFYLSSAQGKERLTAGAKWAVNQASINQQDVRNTAVPLPPESEQVRLVAEIDRLLSAAAVAAATVEQNTRRSDRLRQAVLKWAFEGKLVDQDPEDEPAEKLLARIRTERAVVAPTKKSPGRRDKGAA